MNTLEIKRIAIVTDDSKRIELIEWSYFNREVLSQHQIIASGSTADLLQGTLNKSITATIPAAEGYREVAQMIENQEIDILISFGDPNKSESHQAGLIGLLISAISEDIIVATNLATANLVVNSLSNTKSKKRQIKNKAAAWVVDEYGATV